MNLLNKLLGRGEDEVLPEGMIRDPNTGEIILDPNRANKNVIMGQSKITSPRYNTMGNLQAGRDIVGQMIRDRETPTETVLPDGSVERKMSGKVSGLKIPYSGRYHDEKSGISYALADTSEGAGVKYTPLTPPPEIESTGNRTLDAMAQNRLNPNQPTTTGSDAPSWVENPPPGHVVGSGASRDLQISISKAEMAGSMKGGEPAIERYFDQSTGQTYTLHPIAGGEASDYTLEPQEDGSVKRTNKALIQKPTEEELIKQELEKTRPDAEITAPPPPPPEALPETSPPIPRPKVPVGEGPVSDDSIPTPDNTGLDLNLDEFAPPKENPVETDELIKAIREQEGFVSEDPKLGPLDLSPDLQGKVDRVIDPIKSFVSETGSDTSGTNFPAFNLHPTTKENVAKGLRRAGEKIENFELPSSDPQRRVLAEEAYGKPIENPPPMDEGAIRARNELIPDSLENLDELTKRLISSESPEFNRGETNIPIEGRTIADPDATRTEIIQNGQSVAPQGEDELLQKIVESEFVGPRQGPRGLTPKYEDQGPITPLKSEDLPLRTQAFIDPSVSGFGGTTETSPNDNAMTVDQGMRGMPPNAFSREETAFVPPYLAQKTALELEDDRRRRAEEIVDRKFGSQGSLTSSPLLGNLVRGRDEFNREEEIKKTIEDLKRTENPTRFSQGPQNQIIGESKNYTTEQLREMAARDKAIMEETQGQEVIPISESEKLGDSFDEEAIEGRSNLDDLEPISAKAREARIDPVTQIATPATEKQDQGSGIFSSILANLGQTVKDNPEVAAQLAQLAGNLLSGSVQGRAQRKADAETQRRLARANMIGAFTGKTPGVQSATADTGGFFSLDTLGKALTGGGKIATGEMQRRVEEAERKRVADLEERGFKREGKQFDDLYNQKERDNVRKDVVSRMGLSIDLQKMLNTDEYNDEALRLQEMGHGITALNNYYRHIAEANKLKAEAGENAKGETLGVKEIKEFSSQLSTLEELDNLENFIIDSDMSFLEQGPFALDEPLQYIFGSDAATAKAKIQGLIREVAQSVPGVLTEQDQKRLEAQLIGLNQTNTTVQAIANSFRESLVNRMSQSFEAMGGAGNYNMSYFNGQLDAYKQRKGIGLTDEEKEDQAVAKLGKV
jgi:hypothetical protein